MGLLVYDTTVGMLGWLLILACCWLRPTDGSVSVGCDFPEDWQGRWYQSSLGTLVVGHNAITKKGVCREHHRDYYLVENRERNCRQCLLMMQPHPNIIQYKESYCINKNSLHHICAQIKVEAILYTLVREASTPLPCPFHGSYGFRYDENSGGFCDNEASHIRHCASDAHFRFLFRPCDGVDNSLNKDLDFKCLATWKDGSDTYMYGEFSGEDVSDKDDAYRCFMYETMGSVVRLAVSADATCRGLRSPSDGPLVMELTRDTGSEVAPSGVFPRWLTRTTWCDLAGRHVFSTDAKDKVLSMTLSGFPNHVTNSFRCVDRIAGNTSQTHTLALSSASEDCEVRYQCIKIVKRHRNVLEIHKGRYFDSASEVCTEQDLATASVHTIIPTDLASSRCPYRGKYLMRPDDSTCQVDVLSGCSNVSHISIVSSCVPHPVGNLQCLQTWTEDNRKYVIARRLRDGATSSGANCFSFKHKAGSIEFTLDHLCNHGAPSMFAGAFSYTLQPQPEDCDAVTTAKTIYELPKRLRERHRRNTFAT